MTTKTGSIFVSAQHYLHADGEERMTPRGAVPSPRRDSKTRVSAGFFMDGEEVSKAESEPLKLGRLDGGRDVSLEPGVHVLFGLPGAGKTTILQSLQSYASANDVDMAIVGFGEPDSDYFGSIADLASAIDDTIAEYQKLPGIVAVDSIKSFLYRSSGNLGARGTSATLGEDLAIMHLQARNSKIALILVVNPATDSQEIVDTLIASLRAGVGSVIHVRSPSDVAYSSRQYRDMSSIQFDFTLSNPIARESSVPASFIGNSETMRSDFVETGGLASGDDQEADEQLSPSEFGTTEFTPDLK